MTCKKRDLPLTLVSTALTLGLLIIPSLSTSVQAKPFEPEKSGDAPRSTGGASRGGGCEQDAKNVTQQMTALTPVTNKGLTATDHPTFLLYIPEHSSNKGFLSVQGVDNDYEYQTFLEIAGQSGIVSISLPKDAPALEQGKNYNWSFVLICQDMMQPDDPMIQSQIQRISSDSELSLLNRLEKANTTEEKGRNI